MDILEFNKVTPDDADTIRSFLDCDVSQCCDYTCGVVIMWQKPLNLEYAISDNMLFLKSTYNGSVRFYMPCGNSGFFNAIEKIKHFCDKADIHFKMVSVSEEHIEKLRNFFNVGATEVRDYFDYVYDAESLSFLSGKKLHQKRNHIAVFKKLYPQYTFEIINEKNFIQVKNFFDFFCKKFPPKDKSEITERECTETALDNMKKIGLFGAMIKVDGKVIAFTLGEIKKDVLYVHIEKADREYSGVYAVINNEFVKFCCEKYAVKWVNREDDSGEAGLRKAKLSYQPDHLAVKFLVDKLCKEK